MTDLQEQSDDSVEAEQPNSTESSGHRFIAAVLAAIVPGAGHFYLRRIGRSALFAGIVLVCALLGCYLEGRLDTFEDNNPLSVIATLASMGSGVVYFTLRLVLGYQGDIIAAGFEYGTTFLRTAGILNLLLVLDAFDIARGRKS